METDKLLKDREGSFLAHEGVVRDLNAKIASLEMELTQVSPRNERTETSLEERDTAMEQRR